MNLIDRLKIQLSAYGELIDKITTINKTSERFTKPNIEESFELHIPVSYNKFLADIYNSYNGNFNSFLKVNFTKGSCTVKTELYVNNSIIYSKFFDRFLFYKHLIEFESNVRKNYETYINPDLNNLDSNFEDKNSILDNINSIIKSIKSISFK